MTHTTRPIFIGETQQHLAQQSVSGEYVTLLGDTFYRIDNYDAMPPFFMSVVSSSNHWLFISSTGGLSAGRVSAEQALFPYYTDDKLTESASRPARRPSYWSPAPSGPACGSRSRLNNGGSTPLSATSTRTWPAPPWSSRRSTTAWG